MTVYEAVKICDNLRPNNFSDEIKCSWLYELDGKVNAEIFENKFEIPLYNVTEHKNKELLIDTPYDDLYLIFMISKIDLYSGEYARYSNDALVFNTEYLDFMRYKSRTKEVKKSKFKVV